jgi:hypothetical protein
MVKLTVASEAAEPEDEDPEWAPKRERLVVNAKQVI